MFEREIKFIYDFTTNKVKKSGQYLTFEQLKECGIHPAILQYVSAEIDYLVFEDRQRMLKESVFDYSGEVIDHYFSKITQEIKKEKRFSLEYINKLILHAASFTVNYLIKPKWSLTKFIFDDKEHKTTTELKQILNYVYYYGYLKKILISYIDKKELLSINADEFDELFGKIDKLGLETYKENVIDTALDSMADFFGIGSVTKGKVPLSAVKMYLDERGLEGQSVKLSAAFTDENILKYDIGDIKHALEADLTVDDGQEADLSEEPIEEYVTTPEPEGETVTEEIEEIELPGEDATDEVTEEDIVIEEESAEDYSEEEEVVFGADEPEPEKEDVEMDDTAVVEADSETETGEEHVEEPEQVSPEEAGPEIEPEETIEEPEEIPEIEEAADEVQVDEIEEEPAQLEPDEEEVEELNIPEPEETDFEEAFEVPEEEETTFEDDFEEIEETEEAAGDVPEPEDTEESEIMWGTPPDEEMPPEEEEPEDKQTEPEEAREDEGNPFAKFLEEQFDEDDEPTLFGKEEAEEEPDSNLEPSDYESDALTIDGDVSNAMSDAESDEQESEEEYESEEYEVTPPTPEQEAKAKQLMDISELLENKDVSKIIAVVFDYDMEDFANTIDKISDSATKEEAMYTVTRLLEANQVSPKSKEAQSFISIVDEYFDNK